MKKARWIRTWWYPTPTLFSVLPPPFTSSSARLNPRPLSSDATPPQPQRDNVVKKTTPAKSTRRTHTKPIPQDVLRSIRKKDRKRITGPNPPPNPYENLEELPSEDDWYSGNYITPQAPDPDDL
jgi:hypothetical protein